MFVDDDEVVDDPGEGTEEETVDDILEDLDTGAEEPEEEDKDEPEEKDESEKKGKPAEKVPPIKDLIEEAKEDLRKELGKKADSQQKTYTHDDLNAAEDKLDEMLDDAEIDRATYRKYMRNIQNIRKTLDEQELVLKIEKGRKKETAEQGITAWAQEHSPELLDKRTKEYKESMTWAESTLGAYKSGDDFVIPGKVGPVVFGILYKGQKGDQSAEQGKGKSKTYEDGLREKKAREKELRSRENGPPRDKGKSGKDSPPTEQEKEVMERLGISSISRYRKLKSMAKGQVTVRIK